VPPPALAITTPSILPGTIEGRPYSVTLAALNGQGTLKWSIAPISPNTVFVTGLTINADTGVLSGTPSFYGTGGFSATVTDSAGRTATQGFTVTVTSALMAGSPLAYTARQFQDINILSVTSLGSGGVFPLTYNLTGACLPLGLRLDSTTGLLTGSAVTVGTYLCTVDVTDSFTPPEMVSGQLTIAVIPPPFTVNNSLPSTILLNRPFSGRVVATGGIPPYQFSLAAGSTLPPGFSGIDPSSGQVSGTPTTLGMYNFTVNVNDSSSPPQTGTEPFTFTVATPLGRNDTPATATPIGNGSIMASISPYIDPPDNAPLPNDTDYYKLVSLADATVHVETSAQRSFSANLLDTVIEIVDGNNTRYASCRQPGDTGTTFASDCVNDDISTDPVVLDSALDFQVPGTTNSATTFYVHVLDWRGDARPDMQYFLNVSGVVSPLAIQSAPLLPAARGLSYSQQLSSTNGIGNVSWSLVSGSLPPGLTLNSSGAITGTATLDGTYSFTVGASDSGTPPQKAPAQEAIQVAEPVQITSSATLPDACVNQPYTFAVQTSGGIPPLLWSFVSLNWVGISLNQSNGTFGGMSSVTGTFTGTVGVNDATTHGASQQLSLTVKQCP